MKKRQIIVIGSVIAILIASAALSQVFSGMKPEQKKAKKPDNTRYVQAEYVNYNPVKSPVRATGRLASMNYVDIISEVSGMILAGDVPLKKGQSFNKGDLLCRIFEDEAALALKARKSRFLNLIANLLPDFKIDYPKSYPDWQKFFESIDLNEELPELPEINSNQEKIYLASKNILSEYYSIKSDEIRLDKHNIHAPFNGTFTQVLFEVGAVANPGTRIAKIIRTDRLELEVPVENAHAKWIDVGDPVKVTTDDRLDSWKGTVIRKSDFVDPATQSMSIFVIMVTKNGDRLYKGQYLVAEFPGDPVRDVMEIPRNAIFNHNEVFIIVDGRLQKREINIVKMNEKTLLFNGLEEKQQIVTEPLINAAENTMVEVLQ